jgi:hypothetical protein
VPGRHAFVFDDFRDRLSPARDLVIVGQGERSDVSLAMAFNAVSLQNAGNLVPVRHGPIYGCRRNASDVTADGFGERRGNGFALEQFVDRRSQFTANRLVARVTDSKLVVDSSRITNDAFLVQHDHFRSPSRTDRIRQVISHVFEHRKLDSVNSNVGADLRHGVLRVRIHAEKDDAFGSIFGRQLFQPRSIELRQGTFGPQESQNDDRPIREFSKRILFSAKILKLEVADGLANLRRKLRFACRRWLAAENGG